ncbi:MAG TPA: hypothetical protein VJU82_03660 [Acidobacteriaceae bacterium]|nr:hypothetical protein [Acidobacteriaceae bacterium]
MRHQLIHVFAGILVVVGAGHHFDLFFIVVVIVDRNVQVIRIIVAGRRRRIDPDAFIESVESIAELHRGILFTAIAPSHSCASRPR